MSDVRISIHQLVTTSAQTQVQLAEEMDRWASVANALGMKPK